MLRILRIIVAAIIYFGGSLLFFFLCLLRPFNVKNGLIFANTIPYLTIKVLGVDYEIRHHNRMKDNHPCVFIANHQHALDLVFMAAVQCVPVVAIGKKQVLWVPFFGVMYWLSGQVLIDRKNHEKAMKTMANVAQMMKKKSVSVWIFPEGTRSNGKPLQPFKKGAFYLAVEAQVPLLPMACSSLHKHIDLNKWNAGRVVVDVMEPISTAGKTTQDVNRLIEESFNKIKTKTDELDAELAST